MLKNKSLRSLFALNRSVYQGDVMRLGKNFTGRNAPPVRPYRLMAFSAQTTPVSIVK